MNSASMLNVLNEKISGCTQCKALAATRTQTVPGEGNPDAKIFYLGEAPGWDEDETGRPFVGVSGQRLRSITEEVGWKVEDIFITNVLKCRPPRNRTPKEFEMSNCNQYLEMQIRIIRPRLIVCWGKVAAWWLLNRSSNFSFFRIGSMRGVVHNYGASKVLCTYHPSYVIRDETGEAHQLVVNDLKWFQEQMSQ